MDAPSPLQGRSETRSLGPLMQWGKFTFARLLNGMVLSGVSIFSHECDVPDL